MTTSVRDRRCSPSWRASLLASCLLVAVVAPAPASAGGLPGAMDGESSRGKSYSRDVNSLFADAWRRKCTLDDEAAWKADVAKWRARAGALEEPADRINFTYYFDEIEKWRAREVKGIAGVGTWAELKRRFTDTLATTGTAADDPGEVGAPGQFEAALARSLAIRAAHRELAALQQATEEASTCAGRIGDFQAALRGLETRRQAVDAVLAERYRKVVIETATLAPFPTTAPTTWSEARRQLMDGLVMLTSLEAAPPSLEAYLRFGELIDSSDVASLRKADQALGQLRQTLPAHVESLIRQMTLAPSLGANGKIKAFTKQVIGRVQTKGGGKVLHHAMTPKTRVFDYTEVDKVSNRTHAVTEETANVQYVLQPAQWTRPLPALPTLKPDEICELHSVALRYFKKAGPSHPLKKWSVAEEGLTGYLLCKHARTKASFKE